MNMFKFWHQNQSLAAPEFGNEIQTYVSEKEYVTIKRLPNISLTIVCMYLLKEYKLSHSSF